MVYLKKEPNLGEEKKVGATTIFDSVKSKMRKLNYKDVKYDFDGWADAKLFLPADCDLVYLRIKDGIKTLMGWCTGCNWDGLKVEPEHEILYWKKHE